ncbi:meiotically up-regulated protein C8C9.04-like isoform X1 [Lycium ferocissimum]|uniref:meiotically up-regulated protein C8C9.04-like isoform X1 n=1 Tax=Lycium ferocissimum TaxID=112874 RepID=UPI0028159FD1|nr:meiotically up-regulated protein C8C9.04-like isoform X1 [Lycium ferocissimum]
MDQLSLENPNLSKKKNQEKGMDKLRELILKLANSEPNVPLSATQNSLLQEKLNHFLSCLHAGPDHPPYAWMIEKALQELNEEGGSSEDSISEFIKKEYDSLPWAHTTLLKRHLQMMSEKGEVLMTDGGRFSLPGDNKSMNQKRKRKRKRRPVWEVKQKKLRKKQKKGAKRVQHDGVEVAKEQKKLAERQNEVTVDGKQGQENQVREEYRGLDGHHNDPSTDKEDGQSKGQQNSVTANKVLPKRAQRIRVVHKQKGKQKLDAKEGSVPVEPPRCMMTEEIEQLEDPKLQQPKFSVSRVEKTADISNLCPQEIVENEQPGVNVPQILSPEAPPGFEFRAEEDATANKAHNSSSVGLDSPKEDHVVDQSSERPAEDQVPRMGDLSDELKQSRESPKQQRHTIDESLPSETVLSLNQNEQQSLDTERLEEESVAEDLLKTKKQQKVHHDGQQTNRPTRTLTRAQTKGTVIPNAPMEISSEPQQPSIPRKMTRTHLKKIQNQPAAPTDLFALKHVEQEKSPETKQQVGKPRSLCKKIGGAQQQEQHIPELELESSSEPNQPSIRRKRTRTQQIGIVSHSPSSTDVFALKHLEQENSPETKQQVDKPSEMISPDIHGNLDKGEAQQLTELSKMEGSEEIVLATVEPSSEKKQQPEEGRSAPEKLNVDGKPDVSLLPSPTGFEAALIEKSLQNDRARRQLKRWSKTPGAPKSVSTSQVEPLPFCASSDQDIVHMDEPLETEVPLGLGTREEALNLIDPQHEVNSDQPKQQHRQTRRKYKEDGATLGDSTISALATNEEELCLDDPQDEVHLKQLKHKPRGRAAKGKEEDGADPGTTLLKDLRSSTKLKKKQTGPGRKA